MGGTLTFARGAGEDHAFSKVSMLEDGSEAGRRARS